MVVFNLYPFQQTSAEPQCTVEQAVEMIDIGGPCLLRAAAKNHRHVLVVPAPSLYEQALQVLRGRVGPDELDRLRQVWAARAFALTRTYDRAIAAYLAGLAGERIEATAVWLELDPQTVPLRYGENPHQKAFILASLPADRDEPSAAAAQTPAAGQLSFNNCLDAEACLQLCAELARCPLAALRQATAAVLVKHTNPCGAAIDADPIEAYRKAYLGEPGAAFGGVLAISTPVARDLAEAVMFSYKHWGRSAGAAGFCLDVWIAPSFEPQAIETIRTAKDWGRRTRLLAVGEMTCPPDREQLDARTIAGGLLVQTRDLVGLDEEQWKVVTKRSPSPKEMDDLRFAWLVCKHAKSNAVVIARDKMLLGTGAGQMSRVMSCKIALELAERHLARSAAGQAASSPVAASDAFFPFPDGPETLMDAGVTAIIQPGGSKKDEQVIAACDERNVAMIFTGTRHFRH